MPKSPNTGKGYGHSKQLEALDKLLEPDWDEPSTTVNINLPSHSFIEGLKHMKMPNKSQAKNAGVGAGIMTVILALVELARQLGWLGF